jgi:hypothetical protein
VAVTEHDDIRRLFEGVVHALASDPVRLRSGFQVAELYQRLVPYRTHRAALGFASHQDYEAAMLGLLGGIGGYVALDPAEAQQSLADEAASVNPDPSLVREFAGARVRLEPERVRAVLSGDAAYAPPAPEPPRPAPPPPPPPAPAPRVAPVFQLAGEEARVAAPVPASATAGDRCPACAAALPPDRPVVFCPFCGSPVGAGSCSRCGDALRPEWRFCPRCGHHRQV